MVFPLKTLSQMYKALVRSHLDYCDIIYHIPSTQSQSGIVLNELMEKLEQVQYQAALFITGAWKGTNRSKLYEELGWESLSERRWCRQMFQIHKILNDKTPSYLKEILPRLRRPLYCQNFTNTFQEIRCNSERYKNSFCPNAISSWNIIIDQFHEMPSFGLFKNHIYKLIRPEERSIYGIFDVIGIRYLFQLRLGLSPLRAHKWKHHFCDITSNICICNDGPEDTNHYLFHCNLYSMQRLSLLENVEEILRTYNRNHVYNQERLYLYGDKELREDDNKRILMHTISFLKDSKRFDGNH